MYRSGEAGSLDRDSDNKDDTGQGLDTLARITIKESNSFHITGLNTDPPIFYLNNVIYAAIEGY